MSNPNFLEDPTELAKESRQALTRTVVVNSLILATALGINQLAATAFDKFSAGRIENVLTYKSLYVVALMVTLFVYLEQVKHGNL